MYLSCLDDLAARVDLIKDLFFLSSLLSPSFSPPTRKMTKLFQERVSSRSGFLGKRTKNHRGKNLKKEQSSIGCISVSVEEILWLIWAADQRNELFGAQTTTRLEISFIAYTIPIL